VHDELSRRIPEQGPATIVHGDYRLDNCMVDDDGRVVAVLDWEICTLGDPLADLGLLQVYWTGPNDAASAWTGSATATPGFLDRAELAVRYAAGQRPRPHAPAVLRVVRLLEAGVHPRRRVRPLPRRCARPTRPAELEPFKQQVEGAAAHGARRPWSSSDERPATNCTMAPRGPRSTAGAGGAPQRLDRRQRRGRGGAAAVDRPACARALAATFDGDTFIDYRARRPTMELRDGVNTRLVWSDIELKVGTDIQGRPCGHAGGPGARCGSGVLRRRSSPNCRCSSGCQMVAFFGAVPVRLAAHPGVAAVEQLALGGADRQRAVPEEQRSTCPPA
jgi:hypothetical protein